MTSAAPLNKQSPLASASQHVDTVAHASDVAASQRRVRHRQRLETLLAGAFGFIFLSFAVVVSVETVSRKLFNFSLQGADELGGYALAVGSTLAFTLALMGRAHIRVDVFHDRFPKRLQAWLNAVSIISLAAFGLLITYAAIKVLTDTLSYGSTAPTPWATPLIYPQAVWFGGLVIFAVVATLYALRALGLLLKGNERALLSEFSPKSAKEEVKEELDDLAKRQQGAQ
ncbi:TRAP transporter small permease [Candidimonas sp. SYP-B2681]|uniref:TRAP transporter small permease subunit n=1 Tax=Candidimonas sp. SYP-B2681 TaxID=2497686 RepID=UPI000F86DC0B|nr:TRAP transporter small permease [Candidimonas sp. SYP-B2681]RTZ38870.1 TRAP transporter small permease [Candidimonas sp. SYP-B2681]